MDSQVNSYVVPLLTRLRRSTQLPITPHNGLLKSGWHIVCNVEAISFRNPLPLVLPGIKDGFKLCRVLVGLVLLGNDAETILKRDPSSQISCLVANILVYGRQYLMRNR